MKKFLVGLMLLAMVVMFIGWNSCTSVNGEDGKKGKTGQIGLTGENGTSVIPIVSILYEGEILNKDFNAILLELDEAVFGGIRITNTNDNDSIVVYFSFDENPNIFNYSIICLKAHESFGWYEVIDYNNLYWKSCSVEKNIKIELIKF
jgi:hypothetical protein